jgi:hypothetical protein
MELFSSAFSDSGFPNMSFCSLWTSPLHFHLRKFANTFSLQVKALCKNAHTAIQVDTIIDEGAITQDTIWKPTAGALLK